MANYEQVLHLIHYKNWHTEALFDRKFKLVCSELNGRYISNDFKVEVRLTFSVSWVTEQRRIPNTKLKVMPLLPLSPQSPLGGSVEKRSRRFYMYVSVFILSR